MSAFHVGQKVVVANVNQLGIFGVAPVVPPVTKGDVVTVSRIWDDHLMLVEYPEFRASTGYTIIAWHSCRFRPVAYPKQSLEHDVQLFTKIADRAPASKKRASVKA